MIMKNSLLLILIATIIVSCTSSEKLMNKGKYEAALRKSAKNIKKNPTKMDEVYVFNESYDFLFKRDLNLVNNLKAEGNAANWERIYAVYRQMKERQHLANTLPPVGIKITQMDFDAEINNAKTNASEYAYTKGMEYLNKNDRFEARKAYSEFLKVKKFDANFKDVNQKINEAKALGTTNVLFGLQNSAGMPLPESFIQNIMSLDLNTYNKDWTHYDKYADTTKQYHYAVTLNIKLVEVTPDNVKENNYTETKEVEDGWQYVLDANGNVKKDSLGNDIKVPKYKTISCQIKEVTQSKAARITGALEYFDLSTNQKIKSEPVTAEALFNHTYATANGDLNALKPATKNKLNIQPVPFPTSEALILQSAETIKPIVVDALNKNKALIK